jgi:hypothetical protein
MDRRPSLVAFRPDEKEVAVAFLNLGCGMKRPELLTLFGDRDGNALVITRSNEIGRAPTQAK